MGRWDRYDDYYGYPRYVTAAERKKKAQQKIQKLSAKGEKLSPVVIEGRAIAKTFWGKAWCDNIESYHDYENRLPRGRSYVRNGSVIDLRIEKGKVYAQVMGSELYEIEITIKELTKTKWDKIKQECAGKIASLIDLIQGKLSSEIIALLCRKDEGLFPSPKEIVLNCNCPDWADLCKHLAAVMYGIGARLDSEPELFFLLRGVDQHELFSAGVADSLAGDATASDLGGENLEAMFGIELDDLETPEIKPETPQKRKTAAKAKTKSKTSTSRKRKQSTTGKTAAKKSPAKKTTATAQKPVTKKAMPKKKTAATTKSVKKVKADTGKKKSVTKKTTPSGKKTKKS